MNKIFKKATRRLPALALAAAMVMSLFLGALPVNVLKADAASSTVNLLMVDSSVYGADTPHRAETVGSIPTMSEWDVWDSTLRTDHFLKLPEGLARMDGRNLVIYDMTTAHQSVMAGHGDGCYEDSTRKYFKEKCLKDHHDGSVIQVGTSYTVKPVRSQKPGESSMISLDVGASGFNFQTGHTYVIMEAGPAGSSRDTFYGYMPNVELGGSNMYSGKGWQVAFNWTNGTNLTVALDAQGAWGISGSAADAEDPSDITPLMGDMQQPLHNEVQRGGFKFHVVDNDKQTAESQGTGLVTDSYFAVFNINIDAMEPNTFKMVGNKPMNTAVTQPGKTAVADQHLTAGYGYVVVDQNGDNVIDLMESQTFFPAYDKDDVMRAWKKYLEDSYKEPRSDTSDKKYADTATYYTNGLYGVDGSNYDTFNQENNAAWRLFAMGTDSRKVPIVPCMVLKAQPDGTVSTGDYSLPVGNYLVLQVKAGDGYYIDENFAPIVSIGPWYKDGLNTNGSSGYGNGYFGVIADNLENTQLLNVFPTNFHPSGQHPVAYVMSQSGAVDISTQCTGFGVNESGVVGTYSTLSGVRNANYTSDIKFSGVSQGIYIINPNGKTQAASNANTNGTAVGSRRNPPAGKSRFNAYDSITRAGVRIYIADSDDVLMHDPAKHENADVGYKVEPQGDGDLAGARFRVYNDADGDKSQEWLNGWTLNGDGTGKPALNKQQIGIGSDKKLLGRNDGNYKEYVAQYDQAKEKFYFDIPVDELPFGPFRIVQVSTGEGYGQETPDPDYNIFEHVELAPIHIGVHYENIVDIFPRRGVDNWTGLPIDQSVDFSTITAKYVKPGLDGQNATYFPQKLVTGGKLLTVTARDESANEATCTVKIFNVSDFYVYVDKYTNGTTDGKETRYETAQTKYRSQVAGKNLTVDQIANITNGWNDACVYECTGKVADMNELLEEQKTVLPYGTYYVALTNLSDGFTVIGNPGQALPMHVENGKITWTVQIADTSLTPVVTTVLVDSEYLIDSVPVKKEASVTDQVELGNLQLGTDYIVYGAVVDKETGDIAQGTSVKYMKVNGYQPPEASSYVGGENAASLVNEGSTYTTGMQRSEPAYYTWLLKVRDYAQGAGNAMLTNLVSTATGQFTGNGGTSEKTHNAVLGTLRYMSGDASADLPSGLALAELVYPHMDTTAMEGTTLVGYVFVCEGSQPLSAALSAKTIGELMAATDTSVRAVHRSLDDEAQTARIPSLDITAEASYSAGHQIDPTETVTGEIHYGNVEVGCDYRIVATLKDNGGNDILGEDGKVLSVTRNFTARDTSGYESVTFDGLDVAKYNGQRLTVYADLMRVVKTGSVETPYWLVTKGDADSMGWNINDPEPGKNQVDVVVPVVTTVLSDKAGNKEVDFDRQVVLVDKVSYQTLIPNENYVSVLTLVDKDGKPLFDDNGYALTVEKQFTAKAAAQSIEMEITFTATNLRGADIVAFNDLYHVTPNQRALVAFEHNPDAVSQTIAATGAGYRIHFTTSVKDDSTHTQFTRSMTDVGLTDSVTLRNLDPSTPYVLKTELARATSGDVLNQFDPVYTTVTSDADGAIKIDIPIKANLSVFAGQTLVVYQTLYNAKETEVVAEHRDRTDANQMIYVSDIDTVLTGGNGRSKKIAPNLIEHEDVSMTVVDGNPVQKVLKTYTYETEVADQIYYSNLTPGNTYMVTTEIVSQDGRGTVATSNLTFTPMNASGIVTVYLELDVTDFMGKKLVAYETITDTYSNTTIASHQDLMDTDQTVEIMSIADLDALDDPTPGDDIPDTPINPTDNPTQQGNPGKNIQTGVAENFYLYLAIAGVLAVIAAVGGVVYWKKRKQ